MCAWLSSGELSFQAPSWHPRISLCWMGVSGERGGRTRRLCARRGRSGALGSAAAVAGDLCAPSLSRWISQPGLHSSPRLPGATTHVGSGSPKTGSGFENASPLRPPTPVAFGNQGLLEIQGSGGRLWDHITHQRGVLSPGVLLRIR